MQVVLRVVIPQPVASERLWLAEAPQGIHSVPDVSDQRSWRHGCYTPSQVTKLLFRLCCAGTDYVLG